MFKKNSDGGLNISKAGLLFVSILLTVFIIVFNLFTYSITRAIVQGSFQGSVETRLKFLESQTEGLNEKYEKLINLIEDVKGDIRGLDVRISKLEERISSLEKGIIFLKNKSIEKTQQ